MILINYPNLKGILYILVTHEIRSLIFTRNYKVNVDTWYLVTKFISISVGISKHESPRLYNLRSD
jgi:hypothetical protein